MRDELIAFIKSVQASEDRHLVIVMADGKSLSFGYAGTCAKSVTYSGPDASATLPVEEGVDRFLKLVGS